LREIFVSYVTLIGNVFGFGSSTVRGGDCISEHAELLSITQSVEKELRKSESIPDETPVVVTILFWREYESPA
jgi:hypothetical protein